MSSTARACAVRATRAWMALVFATGLTACGSADVRDAVTVQTVDAPGVRYTATLEGVSDDAVRDVMERSLRLFTLADRPPPSRARLERRLETDRDTALRILRSEGYYSASVDGEVIEVAAPETTPANAAARTEESRGGASNAQARAAAPTLEAILEVTPGPLFRLAAQDVVAVDAEGRPLPADRAPSLPDGAVPAEFARAESIVEHEQLYVAALRNSGYPDAEFVDREAVADLEAGTLRVTSRVAPGPKARFGGLTFSGLETVNESFLRTYRPWPEEAEYSLAEVDDLQRDLSATGLFEHVTVEPMTTGEGGAADDRRPVRVNVEEAKHRSVGGGLRYTSDVGPSARAFFEHRNLFGNAERARATALASIELQEVVGTFTRPAFLQRNQALTASATIRREDDDAFRAFTVGTVVSLERELAPGLRGSLGISVDFIDVDESNADGTALLFGLPAALTRDTTDDRLDPRRGTRVGMTLTPYAGQFDGDAVFFGVADVNASAYLPLDDARDYVFAVRGRLASLVGANRDSVPASKRLYSGGGGSVRGYESRFIGPLDANGDPLGGRSAAEAGIELRARVAENVGVVPFVEAGTVSDASVPDFDEGVQVATGLGLRYYTPVGPIRADIAFPVNSRPEDDAFQFYISIGQAF